MKIDYERINKRIMELGRIGRTSENGVNRAAFTPEDKKAQQLVSDWMRQAGLEVYNDHFGNLIGKKVGTIPDSQSIMIGSHIDTVPNGGLFDGTVGVIAGIEVMQALKESGTNLKNTVEVVAFCDEEGARFSSGIFGSRGMVGKVTENDLLVKDKDGITRKEAMIQAGIDIDKLEESVRRKGEIKLYLEMHIEQGPYLDTINEPVGIVTGIAGPVSLKINLYGEAGHAGTVPMKLRKDPMVGAAEIIQLIESLSSADADAPTVGTVGTINAFPSGINVIPQEVELTIDLRDIDLDRRDKIVEKIYSKTVEICASRGLKSNIEKLMDLKPTKCSKSVIDTMAELSKELSLNSPEMVSGAAHDAMNLAEITDIGMIFIRCDKGISHNPKEWAEIDDIGKGTELLATTILHYAK